VGKGIGSLFFKGIGCGGWLAPKVLAIRFAVGKSKKRIDAGGCEKFAAILPARRPGVESV